MFSAFVRSFSLSNKLVTALYTFIINLKADFCPAVRICITILQRRTCSEENLKRLPAVSKQPSRSWKKYSARIIPARRRSWRIMPLPGSGMTGANDEGHRKAIRRGFPAGWLYSSSRNTRDFSRGIRAQKGKLASSRRTHKRVWNI